MFTHFLLEDTKGTYIGARPDRLTIKRLLEFGKKMNIPNLVSSDTFHTTLVYDESKERPSTYTPKKLLDDPIIASANAFEIWNDVLVLTMLSDDLTKRHEELHDKYKFSWSHDSYKPHMTLSYNAPDVDLKELNDNIPRELDIIMFVREYFEPLDIEWTENNG